MEREYYKIDQVLVGGSNLVSEHLSWIIRGAALSTCPVGGILSIVYNKDIPDGSWGGFYGATRSISINLEQHFSSALDSVQEANAMNTGIRFMIFMELLNTVIHEAWHAKVCEEIKDFNVSDLDEPGASNAAAVNSWLIGKTIDVNIGSFGPLLDGLIKEFYDTLKEDVEDPNCKEWKKLQLHMLENNLSFYDAEGGHEVRGFREAMENKVDPTVPWMKEDNSMFNKWHGDNIFVNLKEQEVPKMEPVVEVVAPTVVEPTRVTVEPLKATTAPVEPTVPIETVEPVVYQYATDADNMQIDNPFADDEEVTQYIQPTTQQVAQTTPITPVANNMSALDIAKIGETVMRRMFHHVFSKCGFNQGVYTAPEAVLEPICISDIPGASEVIVAQDAHDANGVFQVNMPVNGFLKGTLSKGGLPEYKFTLKVGGKLHKRLFIVQNSEKRKSDGTLSKWAVEAKEGWLTMMLYDASKMGEHATAYIRLPPMETLGQEKFSLWAKN